MRCPLPNIIWKICAHQNLGKWYNIFTTCSLTCVQVFDIMIEDIHSSLMMMNDSLVKLYRVCILSWAVQLKSSKWRMMSVYIRATVIRAYQITLWQSPGPQTLTHINHHNYQINKHQSTLYWLQKFLSVQLMQAALQYKIIKQIIVMWTAGCACQS